MTVRALTVILISKCMVDHVFLAPVTKKLDTKAKAILKSPKLKNSEDYEVIGVDDLEKMELRVCGIDSYEDARYGCVKLNESEDWQSHSGIVEENGHETRNSIPEPSIPEPKDNPQYEITKESDYDPGYGDIIDLDVDSVQDDETIPEIEKKQVLDHNSNKDLVALDLEMERETSPKPEILPEIEPGITIKPEVATGSDGLEIIDSLEILSELDDLPTLDSESILDQVENAVEAEVKTDPLTPTAKTKPEPEIIPSADDDKEISNITEEESIEKYEDKAGENDEPAEIKTDLQITTTETIPEQESATTQEQVDISEIDNLAVIGSLEELTTTSEIKLEPKTTPSEDYNIETTKVTHEKSIKEVEETFESDEVSIGSVTTTIKTKPELDITLSENDEEEITKITEEKSIEEYKHQEEVDEPTETSTDIPTTTADTNLDITPNENDDEETTKVSEEMSIEESKGQTESEKPAEVSTDKVTITTEIEPDVKTSEDGDKETTKLQKEDSIEDYKEPVGEAELSTEVSTDSTTFEITKSTPIIWSNKPPSNQVLPPELLKCEHNAKCKIVEFN